MAIAGAGYLLSWAGPWAVAHNGVMDASTCNREPRKE